MTGKKPTGSAITKAHATGVAKFSQGLAQYLDSLSLPTTNIVVDTAERMALFQSLPAVVDEIDADARPEAHYVSKFIVASGAGLFDAALNFIWNEVVVRLRERVARFDLSYFFDTAVIDPKERARFSTKDDLQNLSDADLITGCRKCGVISDHGWIQLDFIRDMRNWASAAHPNQAQISGLQLAAWFQTCIREVINREFSQELLEVGRLLKNVREQAFSANDVNAIVDSVRQLPDALTASVLRSLVGHYCDVRLDANVKQNIRLLAKGVWEWAAESARGEVGLKHANFSANGDVDRKELCKEFLELVDGLPYLVESELALEFSQKIRGLSSAHEGWDNFHNEGAPARGLRALVPASGKVPDRVVADYVGVVVRCRVGRPSGISHGGLPHYDEMVQLFGDAHAKFVAHYPGSPEAENRLTNSGCAERFRSIVKEVRKRVAHRPLTLS